MGPLREFKEENLKMWNKNTAEYFNILQYFYVEWDIIYVAGKAG